MKKISFFILCLFAANTFATIAICKGGSSNTVLSNASYSFYISFPNVSYKGNLPNNPLDINTCYDSTKIGSIYLSSEVDQAFAKTNSSVEEIKNKVNSQDKRIFNIEQALSQDIQIPDSIIEKLKSDLKAELKDELKKEIIEELKSSK